MATIADTLNEIPKLQSRVEALLTDPNALDRVFLTEVMNFTSVYYFGLLSHACMDDAVIRKILASGKFPKAKKYYELFVDPMMLDEYVRWQNIGGIFSLWVIFEKFIVRQHNSFSTKETEYFEKAHDKILKKWGLRKTAREDIHNTFKGIRRTRNALHDDGIYYNEAGKDFEFKLEGEKFTLRHGEPVVPLRLMTMAEVMLDHYIELANAKRNSGRG